LFCPLGQFVGFGFLADVTATHILIILHGQLHGSSGMTAHLPSGFGFCSLPDFRISLFCSRHEYQPIRKRLGEVLAQRDAMTPRMDRPFGKSG